MTRLRNDRESVLRAYDVIAGEVGMTEELFQEQYEPRIQEITDKKTRLDIAGTKCAKDARVTYAEGQEYTGASRGRREEKVEVRSSISTKSQAEFRNEPARDSGVEKRVEDLL